MLSSSEAASNEPWTSFFQRFGSPWHPSSPDTASYCISSIQLTRFQITQQAMNYAIRSGVVITSTYAINQCSRLLKNVDPGTERDHLQTLQLRLESKIRIISPAIDMIELIAARGNTSLDSAVSLTKAIRMGIQALGTRMAKAATDEELARRGSSKANTRAQADLEVKLIIKDIQSLLSQIEDAVPLINLAITTSGVNLSTALPVTVSPSRLLQASTFLSAGDSAYSLGPGAAVQVGPVFVLSCYMLFSGHAYRSHDEHGIRETTWKEVIHKARVKLMRVPLDKLYDLPGSKQARPARSSTGRPNFEDADYFPESIPSEGKAYEFAYQLVIIEDLDDDRVHTFEENEPQPGPVEDVPNAGIRDIIPIHEVSKIFYADTGKILNIGAEGEANNPVLLLKRDTSAVPPRRMMENQPLGSYDDESPNIQSFERSIGESEDEDDPAAQLRRESSAAPLPQLNETAQQSHAWRFPPNLDPEWIAFEVYTEEVDSDDDEQEASSADTPQSQHPPFSRSASTDPITTALSSLHLKSQSTPSTPHGNTSSQIWKNSPLMSPVPLSRSNGPTTLPPLRTALSLLELLIRLTALQQFQQSSHLAINDELLNFFLSESSSTGAGADSDRRKMMRNAARRRVGFDPYNESPVKFRGEEYLHQYDRRGNWEDPSDDDDDGYVPRSPISPGREPSSNVSSALPGRQRRNPDRKSSSSWKKHSPSSQPAASPSPSFRASAHGGVPLKSSATPPVTPQGPVRSRTEILKRDLDLKKRSPLGRSDADSTLGTSPRIVSDGSA